MERLKTSGENMQETKKERLTTTFGFIVLFSFGLILLYGFYRLDNSEAVAHYLDVGSGNFRFIGFIGILKYGTLILGAALTIMAPIFLIKK
jgi:hypothetical protein